MSLKSTAFSLQTRDFLRGLVIAIGTSVALVIQQSISVGELTFNWKLIGMAAVGGGISYLLKNFLTDDTKSAVKNVNKAGGVVLSENYDEVILK